MQQDGVVLRRCIGKHPEIAWNFSDRLLLLEVQVKRRLEDVRAGLGQRIRTARCAIGVTQAELAQRAYVSLDTVSRAERGSLCPSLTTIVALAIALETSVDTLVGLTPPERVQVRPALVRLQHAATQLSDDELTTLARVLARVPAPDTPVDPPSEIPLATPDGPSERPFPPPDEHVTDVS